MQIALLIADIGAALSQWSQNLLKKQWCAGSNPQLAFIRDKPWHGVVFKSHQLKQNQLTQCPKPHIKLSGCVFLPVFPSFAFHNNKYQTTTLGIPGSWIGRSQSPFNMQMISLWPHMAACQIRIRFINTELRALGGCGACAQVSKAQRRAEFVQVQESKDQTFFFRALIFFSQSSSSQQLSNQISINCIFPGQLFEILCDFKAIPDLHLLDDMQSFMKWC